MRSMMRSLLIGFLFGVALLGVSSPAVAADGRPVAEWMTTVDEARESLSGRSVLFTMTQVDADGAVRVAVEGLRGFDGSTQFIVSMPGEPDRLVRCARVVSRAYPAGYDGCWHREVGASVWERFSPTLVSFGSVSEAVSLFGPAASSGWSDGAMTLVDPWTGVSAAVSFGGGVFAFSVTDADGSVVRMTEVPTEHVAFPRPEKVLKSAVGEWAEFAFPLASVGR